MRHRRHSRRKSEQCDVDRLKSRRWRFISSGTLSLLRRRVASPTRRSASTSRNLLSVSKSISWKRELPPPQRYGAPGKSEVRNQRTEDSYGSKQLDELF